MIQLSRLRNTESFLLNPDHIERIEHHHDTHVHLFNGNEYVVAETPGDIADRVLAYRARILAVAARLSNDVADSVFEGG